MSAQLLALEEVIKRQMQLVTAVGMIGEGENHTAHLSSLPLGFASRWTRSSRMSAAAVSGQELTWWSFKY